jgi:hypothetical protein
MAEHETRVTLDSGSVSITGADVQPNVTTRVTLDSGSVSITGADVQPNVIVPADTTRGLERQLAAYVLSVHAVVTMPGIPDGRDKYRLLRNLFLQYQDVLFRIAEGRDAGPNYRPEFDEAVAFMRAAHARREARKAIIADALEKFPDVGRSTLQRWFKDFVS